MTAHEVSYRQKASHQFGPATVVYYQVVTQDSVALTIGHLEPQGHALGHVVLLHGTYTNRHFWISCKGVGLAAYLAGQGYHVWLPEFRGHGDEGHQPGYAKWHADDVMHHDMAAISAFLQNWTSSASWVGHSYGGLYLLGALAQGWLPEHCVDSIAIFGTQLREGQQYLRFPPLAWGLKKLTGALGGFPSKRLGMGPENEPPTIMADIIDWKRRGRWTALDGSDYETMLAHIGVPVRVYAGAGDTMDPPAGCSALYEAIGSTRKAFQLLGREEGFQRDYDHVGMIASKAASEDVWPDLADWLERFHGAGAVLTERTGYG